MFDLKKQIKEKFSEVDKKDKEMKILQTTVTEVKKKVLAKEEENKKLVDERKKLKQDLVLLDNKLAVRDKENDNQSQALKTFQHQSGKLETENTTLKSKVKELESQVHNLTKSLEAKEKELHTLTTRQTEEEEGKNPSSVDATTRTQDAVSTFRKFRSTFEGQQEEIARLQQEINRLNKILVEEFGKRMDEFDVNNTNSSNILEDDVLDGGTVTGDDTPIASVTTSISTGRDKEKKQPTNSSKKRKTSSTEELSSRKKAKNVAFKDKPKNTTKLSDAALNIDHEKKQNRARGKNLKTHERRAEYEAYKAYRMEELKKMDDKVVFSEVHIETQTKLKEWGMTRTLYRDKGGGTIRSHFMTCLKEDEEKEWRVEYEHYKQHRIDELSVSSENVVFSKTHIQPEDLLEQWKVSRPFFQYKTTGSIRKKFIECFDKDEEDKKKKQSNKDNESEQHNSK